MDKQMKLYKTSSQFGQAIFVFFLFFFCQVILKYFDQDFNLFEYQQQF